MVKASVCPKLISIEDVENVRFAGNWAADCEIFQAIDVFLETASPRDALIAEAIASHRGMGIPISDLGPELGKAAKKLKKIS